MKPGSWILAGIVWAGTALGNIGGFCAAVDVDGTNAYVGAGQILLKLDVSDAAAPSVMGSLALPGRIEDLLADGTTLYAACGEAGVVRMRATLEQLETYDSPGHAYGLALNGTALYLADGVGGLQQLDAQTLELTDRFVTNGPAMDVAAENAALFLLDHFNGVIKLDPTLNPTDGYGRVAFGNRMESDGTRLYVADGLQQITQIDSTTMMLSTTPPAIPTFGIASGMALHDGKLYVADGLNGLSIYDASTAAPLGSFSGVARSRATAISAGRAYVASGNQGIRIFDLSNPTRPVYLSTIASGNAVDVALSANLLLVADAFEGLKVFNAATHAHLGTYTPAPPAIVHRVGANDSLAFIAEGYSARKLNLSNPAAPIASLSYRSPNYIFDLDVAGTNVLLATGDNGLEILSTNLQPRASAALSNATFSISSDRSKTLADWSLLDMTDPLTPVAATNFAPLVRAMQMTLTDQTLYASADDRGTAIIALPQQPLYAVAGIEPGSEGVALNWLSEAGQTYTLHKSTNLVEGFYVLRSEIEATEPINTHVDLENHRCAMYMITVD